MWSLGLVGLELLGGLPQQELYAGNGLGFQLDNPYANGWRGAIGVHLKNTLKRHIMSSATPGLIVTLFTMLEVDSKQRFSAQKALVHLREHSELAYSFFLEMDLEEQSTFGEDDGGMQW